MREYTLRKDGLCNTITTVQKDNYIAELPILRCHERQIQRARKSRAAF